MSDPGARMFESVATIDAPADIVWRALSDGEELKRWFPIESRVTPPGPDGRGGSIFLSWGSACEGEAPITIWEPQRCLAWTESHEGGAVQIAVEFHLESRGGQTVLRLVQSGFGRGAKWDDYYDSISNGWKFELKSLGHYLARHRGADRSCVWLPVPSSLSMAECWARLANHPGLLKQGSMTGWTEGREYQFAGPDGNLYSGICLRHVDGKVFAGTVQELGDAVLRLEIERMGAGCMPCFWLSIWGPRRNSVTIIGQAWNDAMRQLVGTSDGAGGECGASDQAHKESKA